MRVGSRHCVGDMRKQLLPLVLGALLAPACGGGDEAPAGTEEAGAGGRGGGAIGSGGAAATGSGGAPGADAAGGSESDGISADAGATPAVGDAGNDAQPPQDSASEGAAAGSSILLVVGNENGTSMRGEGIGDKFLRARLESQGHRVTLAGDNLSATALGSAAGMADLVIVSESVGSAMLQAKLKSVPTPS